MRKITALLLTSLAFALGVYAKELNYPTTIEKGKEYYIYKVKKSEGFYAISKKFNVTIKEIMDANPIEGGLKLGQELKIPTGRELTDSQNPTESVEATPTHHIVQKGETLYSLSKKYGVTVDELKKINPDCNPLSIGYKLKIPQKAAAQTTPQSSIHRAELAGKALHPSDYVSPSEDLTSDSVNAAIATAPDTVTVARDSASSVIKRINYVKRPQTKVRMAVLMPFNLDTAKPNEKFVDFYKGCLIAADSLASIGLDVTIDTYDIGKTKESLYKTLQNRELTKANIIIGPAYTAQIPLIAEFASHYKIKTIIPFSNNVPQVNDNKYIFQIVSPQNLFYESLATQYADIWKDKHIVIIKPDSAGIHYNKKEFTDILTSKLAANGTPYRYISDTNVAGDVNAYTETLKDTAEVVVVIPTSNNVNITQIADHIERITYNNVAIFGFPEWNEMLHKDIYNKPLYMFTNHWLRFDDPETIKFYKRYNNKFGTPPVQNNPSYTIFGFDITLYFGKAWMHSGDQLEGFLDEEHSEMLQMNLKFDKRPNGGYVNHGLYLQRYDKNGITLLNKEADDVDNVEKVSDNL